MRRAGRAERPHPTPLATTVALGILVLYAAMTAGAGFLLVAEHSNALFLAAVPIVFATYPAVGALIILRQGSHAVGWILEAIGVVVLVMISSGDYALYALVDHPGSLPFGEVFAVASVTVWTVGLFLIAVLLPLLFPTGHLLSRRWWVVIGLYLSYAALVLAGNAFVPGAGQMQNSRLANPIGIHGHDQLFASLQAASLLPGIATLGGVIAAVIVRFRRSSSAERQQLKFFLFSVLLLPVPLALNGVPVVGEAAFVIVLPLLAISIGLAVMRYGLYGIDVVISRTLAYGAMAAFITAVYVGIVVGIGTLVGAGGRTNLVLSIVATAVAAVGFQPVRQRFQRIANGLVYGKRATPYEVLAQFSENVAETYAADEVLPRMARVLAEGTAAQRADVWLRVEGQLRPAASFPTDADACEALQVTGQLLPRIPETDHAVAVLHQGELLGALTVKKRERESLTPIEEKLVEDLAHQAGLVLKNVRLTSELLERLEDLRESRQRLVKAQDEERRRLERNLHDGAQQNLVALKVKLGLAEMMAERDPARVTELIVQLKAEADEALETLRDLARGIYPPLLADRGLKDALETQARKATLPVDLEVERIGRFPQEIEAAVYFCVLEALQNVQKYAHASKATIRIAERDGVLTFEVEDNGKGFDPGSTKKGAGLTNIADRLDALGGGVQFQSQPGAGSVVYGRVPVPGGAAVPVAG